MPQVFKVGTYIVYFWINEGVPLEPIHVHVAEGKPVTNGTKIWITEKGRTIVANNNARIPQAKLSVIMDIIEARHDDIEKMWLKKFGQIKYYC